MQFFKKYKDKENLWSSSNFYKEIQKQDIDKAAEFKLVDFTCVCGGGISYWVFFSTMGGLAPIIMPMFPVEDPWNSGSKVFLSSSLSGTHGWQNMKLTYQKKGFSEREKKKTWRIMTAANIRMAHATKWEVFTSTDPSSVRTSLRTTQKPNQAPVSTTKASRNIANCSWYFMSYKRKFWKTLLKYLHMKHKQLMKRKDKILANAHFK